MNQFHCSMTMSDTVVFVKETKTCNYVMVIQTPRLCGEPGFKTRLEQREEALIRCREVLDSVEAVEAVDKSLPEAAHPFRRGSRTSIIGSPPPAKTVEESKKEKSEQDEDKKITPDRLRRAFEVLLNDGAEGTENSPFKVSEGNEGEVWIEFSDQEMSLEDLMKKLEEDLVKASEKIDEILRGVGYDNHATEDDGAEGREHKKEEDSVKHAHEEL